MAENLPKEERQSQIMEAAMKVSKIESGNAVEKTQVQSKSVKRRAEEKPDDSDRGDPQPEQADDRAGEDADMKGESTSGNVAQKVAAIEDQIESRGSKRQSEGEPDDSIRCQEGCEQQDFGPHGHA